jgi:hypothetical protein
MNKRFELQSLKIFIISKRLLMQLIQLFIIRIIRLFNIYLISKTVNEERFRFSFFCVQN